MTERRLTLSELLCPSVEGVVEELFPIVQDWLSDGKGVLRLPRDWPLVGLFLRGFRPVLWEELRGLSPVQREAVYRRIEAMVTDERRARRRVVWLRGWFFLRVWLCAIAGALLAAGFVNGWAWVIEAVFGRTL